MSNAIYTSLTRQSGLMREMQTVANNIANMSTTGFRKEGVIFAEHVKSTDGAPSLSMATALGRETLDLQGTLKQTGGRLDMAIEGEGFFVIGTPEGERLTRAGHFATNAASELVTADGHPVLDAGGAPIFIPPNAGTLGIASDGTISLDGQPLGQVAVVRPLDADGMQRQDGVLFRADAGFEPAEGQVVQGFLEASNVNAVTEISRMIEVQRAYELGQGFLDKEDERIRSALQALTR
ncbi:flagellar hook-basal body complex protein [Nereida sp. MMG025]|uniref:flagellar hook-basal body complex protein n=1 Tax=Nereida sp. MMG025 TaxID=2909981 RepID=UPI001F19A45D|nr:flagellar hook-basal body complex protein [Nereida sp. MMG025]MCF6444681.1 flagellar hook-basal body complex protein [Nereida sp. MMG025]